MRHAACAGIAAGIAHEAQAAQRAAVVEQHGQDDRMSRPPRPGSAERDRIVDRPPDIFLEVVETGVHLVQAGRLGAALSELRPVGDALAGRTAVAAAGEFAEAGGAHRAGVEAELEPAQLAAVGRLRERERVREQGGHHEGCAEQISHAAIRLTPSWLYLEGRRVWAPACRSGHHSPNTYTIEAVDVCLSSGAFGMMRFGCFEPTSTAMNCLPLTEKLIGGALMPVPALNVQTSLRVLASYADSVPSTWPVKTRLPAVPRAPPTLGYSCRSLPLFSPVAGSTALRLP